MKLSKFTILLSSLTAFSAHPIFAGGEEKKSLTSCLKKAPSSDSFRKRVDFEPEFTEKSIKQSSELKFGVPQKDWDIYSAWDKENKTHGKNITLEFDSETKQLLGVKEIKDADKTRLAKRKQEYIDSLTIADFEWEFAFSALEHVLGLSDKIDDRHTSWNQYPNDEAMMVLRTLAFVFGMEADIETSDYLTDYQVLQNETLQSLQTSDYYSYRAGYDTAEDFEALDPTLEKDFLIAMRKQFLIGTAMNELKNRAQKAKTILAQLNREKHFGSYFNKQSILDILDNCFRDNITPTVLFERLTDLQIIHFKRFVIAMKEASFRFLTPDETDFADNYDAIYYTATSEDDDSSDPLLADLDKDDFDS